MTYRIRSGELDYVHHAVADTAQPEFLTAIGVAHAQRK